MSPMILRITTRLATKLHTTPGRSLPLDANPFTDWSAQLFTAVRCQYILLTNTASLYSTVFYGRGLTDDDRFLSYALSGLGEFLREDGFEFIYERLIVPAAGRVSICKALNRAVTGSMTELVRLAQDDLAEQGLSPWDTALRLNETPMSLLGYRGPRAAFAALRFESGDG